MRIDYVSCRKNRGAEIVKELTGRDVPVLMDPVFALDKEQWGKLIPEEKADEEPYIFCFFLGSNVVYREAVKKFAEKKGLKVVFLKFLDQYVEYDEHFGDITPFDVDPNKFLNILRGAEYVFTDSFHGCAFSILMEKQFVIFNRYTANSGASKHSRIDTVCGNLGLNSRRVTAESDLEIIMNEKIDWNGVVERTLKYRKRMWEYLREALRS